MSKGPSNFRITDLKRGLKGLESAGAKVNRVEMQPGKIVFILNNAGEPAEPISNEWDTVK